MKSHEETAQEAARVLKEIADFVMEHGTQTDRENTNSVKYGFTDKPTNIRSHSLDTQLEDGRDLRVDYGEGFTHYPKPPEEPWDSLPEVSIHLKPSTNDQFGYRTKGNFTGYTTGIRVFLGKDDNFHHTDIGIDINEGEDSFHNTGVQEKYLQLLKDVRSMLYDRES